MFIFEFRFSIDVSGLDGKLAIGFPNISTWVYPDWGIAFGNVTLD
jgi:hypothetical protein